MTRVGASMPGPAEVFPVHPEDGRRHDFGDGRDYLSGGRTAGKRDGQEMRFGQFDSGSNDLREAAFLEKIRRAIGDTRSERTTEEDDRAELRLIAIAGDGHPRLHPVGQAADPGRAAAELGAGRAAEVGALVDRVEQALHASLADRKQAELSLQIDLSDGGADISALTITMSSGSIDLVLTRAGGEATDDYLQAAQMLADTLQARFSRRIVRVLEMQEEPQAKPSQGLFAISRLLTQPEPEESDS